jgi:hypothetical protein
MQRAWYAATASGQKHASGGGFWARRAQLVQRDPLFALLDTAAQLICNLMWAAGLFVRQISGNLKMTELRQALDDISAIRSQVARGTQFRGYGPLSIASSGILAMLVAAAQSHWGAGSARHLSVFLAVWISTAAVAICLSALETIFRVRRVHSGLALEMIQAAAEQFLPCMVVGLLLTVVLMQIAPQDSWMLPGLWAVIFSLGVFASCRFLPRQMFAVGAWYLAAGLVSLLVAAGHHALLPWAMGLPFGIGQLLVAAVLRFGFEDAIEET